MTRRTPPHPDRVHMLGSGSVRGKDFSALARFRALGSPPCSTAESEPIQQGQILILEDFPDPKIARALSPNGRAHWAVKKQARERVEWVVGVAIFEQRLHDMLGERVAITYRWVKPDHRKRDLDNHSTGVVKVVQDCLVRLALIDADDSSCVVAITTEIVYERGRRALEIEIREVGDGEPDG